MNQRQRDEFHRRMKYYEPCARFMSGGGLYGRSRHCPLVASHVCRIFRTCIHLNWSSDRIWFWTGPNANAHNNQKMVPMFAYQIRPHRTYSAPPPSYKVLAVMDIDPDSESEPQWRQAA